MSVVAPPDPAPEARLMDAQGFAALSGATARQLDDLQRFRVLLAARNEVMNLVGPASLPHFWSRHAWDSAQLLRLAPDARSWADLGAGAGLPGIVLAIFGKGELRVHVDLVESMTKLCKFRSEVGDELELPATSHNTRAENLDLSVEIVTARACAPHHRLLGYARPYLQGGATGLFLKGQDVVAEMRSEERRVGKECRSRWSPYH